MTSIESKLKDEDKTLIFLSLFPLSYKHFVTTLFYVKDFIDLEEVTTTFLSNEMRKMDFVSEVQVEAKGLIARGKIKGKGFNKFHQDFKCHYCHKKLNIKTNCPKLKKKKENMKWFKQLKMQSFQKTRLVAFGVTQINTVIAVYIQDTFQHIFTSKLTHAEHKQVLYTIKSNMV